MRESTTLGQLLERHVAEGELYEKRSDCSVTCYACGHRCLIKDGRDGICRVRFNRGGKLYVPRGYVGALQCDPVEKKPFFHAYPGSLAMSFGMLGCDYHCSYCQNWVTSQALRDPAAGVAPVEITPEQFAGLALRYGARIVTSTYNEPLITSEWAVEIFRECRARGLICSYVSNGNATPEVLDYIRPYVDLYKIDLKSFCDKHYRKLGGVLQHVLDSIQMVYARGFWLEVVTLVIPGFNSEESELRDIARFLVSVSPDIPWHVTAFHQDYRLRDLANTGPKLLIRACEIGRDEGLHFVYAGNIPGAVGNWENTYCPGCGELLIERIGYMITQYRVEPGGLCPECKRRIPGRW